MNKIYSLLLSILVLWSCDAKKDVSSSESVKDVVAIRASNDITGNFFVPPLVTPGEGGYIKGELIYPLDNKPTPQCHASTIVETPAGMVAAFFAGTREKDPDVGIRVSRL